MSTITEIIDVALNLPRTDRGYIAKKLIESLNQDDLSDQQKEVIEQRSREVREGNVKPLSREEAKQQVQQKLTYKCPT